MTPNMQKGQSEGPEVYTMTSLLQEWKEPGSLLERISRFQMQNEKETKWNETQKKPNGYERKQIVYP
jgi:hypothetical protein